MDNDGYKATTLEEVGRCPRVTYILVTILYLEAVFEFKKVLGSIPKKLSYLLTLLAFGTMTHSIVWKKIEVLKIKIT